MTTIQLPIMTLQDSLYRSPKRKRDDDPAGPRLITSGFRHNLNSLLADRHDTQSPSARMAGKFQKLDIQSPVEPRNRHQPSQLFEEPSASTSTRQPEVPYNETETSRNSRTPQEAVTFSHPLQSSSFTFEMASTVVSWQHNTLTRSQSVPILGGTSDQFWREDEITGYSPGDPDEDDYGVNGVGYQKTPAIAYAISQRRKQQIADYRSRETREARQRRGERRMNARMSKSPQPTNSSGNSPKLDQKARRAVRFIDG